MTLIALAAATLAACLAPPPPLTSPEIPRGHEPADTDALLAKLRTPPSLRDDWTTFRIAGDLFSATDIKAEDLYVAGPCKVTTPLPEGYPTPTPPGAVELKRYPAARRAEYTSSGDSEFGRNIAFWPLFNHIKKHDIAMTSPVEMDFPSREARATGEGSPDPKDRRWTMSFLYRTPTMNATGQEGKVSVVDRAPVTVIAVGLRGPYSEEAMDDALNTLMQALATTEYRAAGAPRALYYNGPDTAQRNLWSEVQIPITPKSR
jgi:hypothetical protein